MSNNLRDYIDANASLPEEVVLGNLAWFEVAGDAQYAAADLEAGFVKHSLNPGFLPGAINPADAYEKASKGVEGLKYSVSLGGTTGTAVILVREAARTSTQIVRHLIREVKDEGNRRLSYDAVGEMVFYRPVEVAGKIDHSSARVRATLDQNLTPEERTMLQGLTSQFTTDFDRYRNFHDGQKVRGIMRNYLLYLNGILMKNSVYFVHVNRADELQRLMAFSKEIAGVSLALWQIPDVAMHREQVIDAYQTETVKEMTALVGDIQKARGARKGGATPTQYAQFKKKADDILRHAGETGRTLQVSQDATAAAAEMVMDALVALRTEIYNAAITEEDNS